MDNIDNSIGGKHMVDYVEALKRPFSDLTKLLVYIVVSIIPIVSFIGGGYLLDVAETAMKKQKKLPEFKDILRLFVEGIKSFVISLIYMIPVIVVALIAVMISGIAFTTLDFFSLAAISGWLVLIAILAVIIGYFATGAILRYADTRRFNEAFNFRAISKTIFNTEYFMGWLIGFVITVGLVFVIGLIPYIGSLIGAAVGGIFYMSVLGKVYRSA